MRNVSHENEFDLHENYVIKCENTHSTSVCTYAFSVPYLLDLFDTVKQSVVTKLSRTSNFNGSFWHEALLF